MANSEEIKKMVFDVVVAVSDLDTANKIAEGIADKVNDLVKNAIDSVLDKIEDAIKASPNKYDDFLVLPTIKKCFREPFGIEDNDDDEVSRELNDDTPDETEQPTDEAFAEPGDPSEDTNNSN